MHSLTSSELRTNAGTFSAWLGRVDVAGNTWTIHERLWQDTTRTAHEHINRINDLVDRISDYDGFNDWGDYLYSLTLRYLHRINKFDTDQARSNYRNAANTGLTARFTHPELALRLDQYLDHPLINYGYTADSKLFDTYALICWIWTFQQYTNEQHQTLISLLQHHQDNNTPPNLHHYQDTLDAIYGRRSTTTSHP